MAGEVRRGGPEVLIDGPTPRLPKENRVECNCLTNVLPTPELLLGAPSPAPTAKLRWLWIMLIALAIVVAIFLFTRKRRGKPQE